MLQTYRNHYIIITKEPTIRFVSKGSGCSLIILLIPPDCMFKCFDDERLWGTYTNKVESVSTCPEYVFHDKSQCTVLIVVWRYLDKVEEECEIYKAIKTNSKNLLNE